MSIWGTVPYERSTCVRSSKDSSSSSCRPLSSYYPIWSSTSPPRSSSSLRRLLRTTARIRVLCKLIERTRKHSAISGTVLCIQLQAHDNHYATKTCRQVADGRVHRRGGAQRHQRAPGERGRRRQLRERRVRPRGRVRQDVRLDLQCERAGRRQHLQLFAGDGQSAARGIQVEGCAHELEGSSVDEFALTPYAN